MLGDTRRRESPPRTQSTPVREGEGRARCHTADCLVRAVRGDTTGDARHPGPLRRRSADIGETEGTRTRRTEARKLDPRGVSARVDGGHRKAPRVNRGPAVVELRLHGPTGDLATGA